MNVLGLDPGKKGGLAVFTHGALTAIEPMGDVHWFADQLDRTRPHHVFIEKCVTHPRDGRVGAFNYGQHFGELLGALVALKAPHTLIPAGVWQRVMHAGTKGTASKERSREACMRLFPSFDFRRTARCTKFHDGMGEAALIGAYGVRVLVAPAA